MISIRRGGGQVPPRSLAIAVICALVVASAMAGVAVDRIVLRARATTLILADTGFHPISSILRTPTPEQRRALRTALEKELRLTDAQIPAVESIFDAHTQDFRALRQEIRPKVERLVDSPRADNERVLTSER